MHKEAFEFHRKARTLKPEHPSVIQNQIYFHEILGFEKMPQTVLILYSLWHYATYCIVFPALFYSYTLSQISRLIYIQAFGYADIIAKQLQRNNCQ
mgnify:FL=1